LANAAHGQSDRDRASEIVVVTWNVQDLYFAGQDRKRRMRLIGQTLADLNPDVVAIQEAFIKKDRDELIAQLGDSRLQNHAYFGHGVSGSGLLILSALPILEISFHQYQNKGKWYKIWEGDYWAGKGAALVRVPLGKNAGVLDFYNTHMQASYVEPDSFDANAPVRLEQMKELRDFVLKTSRPGNPAILAGDFNCKPGSDDYQLLVEGAGLERLLSVDTELDHILAKKKPQWNYQASPTQVLTTARDPKAVGEEIRLSDHDGYLTKITLSRTP
jgi:sphingomyelin phosphodiesterase 2